MSLSLLWRRASGVSRIDLANPLVVGAAGVAALLLLGGAFMAGVSLGQRAQFGDGSPAALARAALEQQQQLSELRDRLQERVDVLAARIGQVNAHVVRLDALGKRVAELADLDSREFDFGIAPSSGGPESEGIAAQAPDISRLIDDVESRLARRDSQMSALEAVLLQRELRAQLQPEGRPVQRGFQSSGFGWRQDPFTGVSTLHRGIDFAGNFGDPVIAVGGGVVTFAGVKEGYGWVVDITHGDGYVTRYGHNRKLLVKTGDTVTRGQRIAEMGSTGRSTGPHVHFEVLRNGLAVNPLSYIDG
ncbi:MAG: M23 family metallopeptidase [Gammaproteobacteria bacterium]|nr:M23 family metallopeptidase [Gammaproteobacteria bacterium]